MKKKPYQRIDVNLFKKILGKKYLKEYSEISSKKVLLEFIQQINQVVKIIEGLDCKKRLELKNINVREFGFREKEDVNIRFEQEIFENQTRIILTPRTVYELEDKIDLPKPSNLECKLYIAFVSDTFERLKVKAEHIIKETDEIKHIELYAKKNIQMAHRVFYDARILLEKEQSKEISMTAFIIYVQNIFLINVILYLQKMFSSFYNEKTYTKKLLKSELYDSMNLNTLMKPIADYSNEKAKVEIGGTLKQIDDSELYLKWNGQVNILITMLFDCTNEVTSNKKMLLEASVDKITKLLHNHFVDKNGKPINKNTIATCLQKYRDDKRAKGNKKINLAKYIEME